MTHAPTPVECNCAALRAAARHVTQFYDQALAGASLRTSQFSILARLRGRGPTPINALAAELVMDRTTLGRNLLPLQRDGLVSVARAAHDGRVRQLQLTAAGRARLAQADARWADAQRRFEATFGKRKSAALRAMLREVVGTELGPGGGADADDD